MNASVAGGRWAYLLISLTMMIIVCATASALLHPVTAGQRSTADGSIIAVQVSEPPPSGGDGLPWG
jgi:hypothetical protein